MSCIHSIGSVMLRPSRFTGNVWLAIRYTTADSIVYMGGLSAVRGMINFIKAGINKSINSLIEL